MIKNIFYIFGLSIFVAAITTIFITPKIWYENTATLVIHILWKPQWYDDSSERLAYNKALFFAKNWNFEEAKQLLEKIDTLENTTFIRNVLELQWDIAYYQKSNTGQILAYYDRSLEIEKNSRVSYKKSLILDTSVIKKNTPKTNQDIGESNENNPIEDMQKNRSKYLNPQTDIQYQKEEIDRIKRALDESDFTPIKDW